MLAHIGTTSPASAAQRPASAAHPLARPLAAQRLVAASAAGGVGGPEPEPAAPPGSKEAILARIAAAKRYKEGGGAPAAGGAAAPSAGAQPPTAAPGAPADWAGVAALLGTARAQQQGAATASGTGTAAGMEPPPPPTPEQLEVEAERARRFQSSSEASSTTTAAESADLVLGATQAPGRGSAYQPAEALRGVLESKGLDVDITNMRMEEITALKEARLRAQGADILVADANTRPLTKQSMGRIGIDAGLVEPAQQQEGQQQTEGQQQQQEAGGEGGDGARTYEPKVSTWGVFPRPSNISEAYGGGRNIRPGQELETKEQKAARDQQYAQALAQYKQKMGLEVDAEVEAEAEGLYQQGMALFNDGDLKGAYAKFDAATTKVQVRTRVGGLATLQKAVVLDSLGYSEEARKLYGQVQGHAVAQVSRKAKQMLFGFKAATFLKADQISYSVRKADYDPYFRRFADSTRIYVASKEEQEADAKAEKVAAITAVAVILLPLGMAGVLAHNAGAL